MSETYPNKGTRETLFAGHTPSSVGIGCKVTNYLSYLQIKKPLMSKNINGGWVRETMRYANCGVKILLIFHWCK